MLKDFLSPKKSRPKKEFDKKSVPTKRFNEMVDYYTQELKSRLAEIQRLRKENELLIRASIKTADRTDQLKAENAKLQAQLRR